MPRLLGKSVWNPLWFLTLSARFGSSKICSESPLANAVGWLDVDYDSIQHNKYSNVFSLGDITALPTAKADAAIRKQVPIVLDNIKKLMANK